MLPPRAIADVRAGGLRHRTGQPSQAREFGLGRLASHSSARAMDATGPRTSGFQPTPQARHARPRWRQGEKLVNRCLVASLLATGERYQLIPSPRIAQAHRADTCAACLAPSIRTVSPTAGSGLASLLQLQSLPHPLHRLRGRSRSFRLRKSVETALQTPAVPIKAGAARTLAAGAARDGER